MAPRPQAQGPLGSGWARERAGEAEGVGRGAACVGAAAGDGQAQGTPGER